MKGEMCMNIKMKKIVKEGLWPVSYTHLRAHET